MVFIDQKNPMHTLSILTDGLYILSGGVAPPGSEVPGMAFVWNFRNGQRVPQTFECDDGIFLSSAGFPAWQLTGLGCSSNFSFIWDWGGGNFVKLPYFSRTVAEIQEELDATIATYRDNGLNGLQRLQFGSLPQMVKALNNVSLPSSLKDDEMVSIYAGESKVQLNKEAWQKVHDFINANRFGSVNAMTYVPQNLRFATGHGDGKIRFWSSDSGELLDTYGTEGPAIKAIQASPSIKELYSGDVNGMGRRWAVPSGELLLTIPIPEGGDVLSLAVMPGGDKIAVGSSDGYVRIFETGTGLFRCAINTGGGPVNALATNPGRLGQLIVGSDDGVSRVYNPSY